MKSKYLVILVISIALFILLYRSHLRNVDLRKNYEITKPGENLENLTSRLGNPGSIRTGENGTFWVEYYGDLPSLSRYYFLFNEKDSLLNSKSID